MKFAAVLLLLPAYATAQFYNISTVAGNGRVQFKSGQAVNTALIEPRAVTTDAAGNVYVSDTYYNQVFQVGPTGTMTAYAGSGQPGFSGDGGPATAAKLSAPQGLAVDAAGNLYIADTLNSRVRKVSPSGVITTVAVEANGVAWVAVDGGGNLFVSGGHSIYRVDSTGTSTTIAGTGQPGFSGDGGPATAAKLFGPQGLRVDSSGNIFVADQENNRIRKITPQGVISTVAGTGVGGFLGDGGQANSAVLFLPDDIALDGKGNLYISDSLNLVLRMVNSTGVISTIAGGGTSLQNGPPLQAALAPNGISIDGSGNILVAEFNYRQVRRVTPQQTITTIAGLLPTSTSGDNIAATSTAFLDPFGLTVDGAGNLFIADQVDNRVRKVSPAGIVTGVTGNGIPGYSGDGGPAINAEIAGPLGVGSDPAGNLYVGTAIVRRITPAGVITSIAGAAAPGFSGDGGKAISASLLGPLDAVGDATGNVYITDRGNNRVRRVDTSGNITTVAGTGTGPGFSGDGGPAVSAQLYQPFQLAIDNSSNLYIADWGNSRVRKVTSSGTITTVAGSGINGALGDGGPATAASIGANLYGVAVDLAGNLYITSNARIRKVTASTGIISTIAGIGTPGFSGDGGLATLANVDGPQSIAVDSAGNVYFTDENNLRVRKLTPVQIVREGVTNGATLKAGGVAPGEIVTVFGGPGVSLGPASPVGIQIDSSGRVATQLGGTQVTFDGAPAPLTYVSGGQINAVVPYEVAGQESTRMQITVQGQATNTVTLPVVPASPGIFAITNQDGSINSPANPAPAGGVLVLYGTGEGQTKPAGVDGQVNNSVFPAPTQAVSLQIGGQTVMPLYAGAAPGFVSGVLQVNVQIPAGITGVVPLQLTIGNASTAGGLTVAVR